MTLYLKNALFIDWQSLAVKQANIAVEQSQDKEISFVPAVPSSGDLASDDRVLDCTGKLVTKSFGCGHHHIYSTLARGMPAPRKIPANFTQILEYIWWHIDKRLDLEMIEASALASAIFCAKNGVTFVIDHHASPFAVKGSLDVIAKAFKRVGIGSMLCYELSDRDGAESVEQALAETDTFLGSGNQGHVGLHASFTVGEQLLRRAVELAQKHNTGVHVHVAEDLADQKITQEKYGKSVVQRYHDAGVLKLDKSIFAHCVHLSDTEKELLRQSGVWLAQNVESNQNNNVGIAGYNSFASNVMLGTDGMHSDMLRSAKAAFLSGQASEAIGFDGIYQRFRNVHHYLNACGAHGDGDNNLVVLDYDSPTEVTSDNFLGHFVFGIDTRHVQSVICQGNLIVKDRQVTTVDEKQVLAYSKKMGQKLWDKL
ncbi:MAG: amidohydrolase family protein [Desulfobacteraceae bacterium]|nr:amidohydrolase family protein [Desulfobacteraceae bacterium]